jgi:hypothetical protein
MYEKLNGTYQLQATQADQLNTCGLTCQIELYSTGHSLSVMLIGNNKYMQFWDTLLLNLNPRHRTSLNPVTP